MKYGSWARTAVPLLQGADRGVSCSGMCECSQLAPWPTSLPYCWVKPGAPLLQAAGGGGVGQRRPLSTSRSTSRSQPPVSPVASPRGSSAFAQPGFRESGDEEAMQEVAAALAATKAVDKGKKPMTVAEVGLSAGSGIICQASWGQLQRPQLQHCHAGKVETRDQASRGPKCAPKRMLARNRPSPCCQSHCNASIKDLCWQSGSSVSPTS